MAHQKEIENARLELQQLSLRTEPVLAKEINVPVHQYTHHPSASSITSKPRSVLCPVQTSRERSHTHCFSSIDPPVAIKHVTTSLKVMTKDISSNVSEKPVDRSEARIVGDIVRLTHRLIGPARSHHRYTPYNIRTSEFPFEYPCFLSTKQKQTQQQYLSNGGVEFLDLECSQTASGWEFIETRGLRDKNCLPETSEEREEKEESEKSQAESDGGDTAEQPKETDDESPTAYPRKSPRRKLKSSRENEYDTLEFLREENRAISNSSGEEEYDTMDEFSQYFGAHVAIDSRMSASAESMYL